MLDAVERFFDFMVLREELRIQKASGASWPWSSDPILNKYKFTNVKREDDRTTRWMRVNWTGPNQDRPAGEIIFNCALFRYFGTIEFAAAAGWQQDYAPKKLVELARQLKHDGTKVFTGAYIIPTLGHTGPKREAVCYKVLWPLWEMRELLGSLAIETQSWEAVANEMRRLPGFGGTGFMVKETLQDVMQTPVLTDANDRNTWCPAGPGARRGLNRIYGRPLNAKVSEDHLLHEMRDLFALSHDNFPALMPVLELHDIQFQLCEFDKYERARLGEGRPKSLYRIRDYSEA